MCVCVCVGVYTYMQHACIYIYIYIHIYIYMHTYLSIYSRFPADPKLFTAWVPGQILEAYPCPWLPPQVPREPKFPRAASFYGWAMPQAPSTNRKVCGMSFIHTPKINALATSLSELWLRRHQSRRLRIYPTLQILPVAPYEQADSEGPRYSRM